ncbi:MAG: HAMP domain-containing protein, partial [Candidatus Omnitrophota bacterium]
MRLGAKLRLSYVGIVLLAVFLVLFLIIDNSRRELKEKIGRDLHVAAKLEAENIDAYVSDKVAKIKFFSRDRVLDTGNGAAISQYIAETREENPAFSEISFINLSGKTVASTNPKYVGSPFPLHAKGSTELFNKAKSSGQTLFAFGYKNKDKTGVEVFLFAPIKDESGSKVRSILAASVSMDHILKPADRFNLQTVGKKVAYPVEHASKMIMTQDGRSQVFTPLVYLQADSDLRGLLKKGGEGYVAFRDPERGAVIAGYADLKEYGTISGRDWAVISMAPQKEVFSPAVRLRNKMIVLGIIAIAVAWIVSVFVARGISRPVIKLADVTDKIAKGDLSQRANIDLSDEVGDLARSFNKMTDELNSAIAARDQEIIERKNAEERLKEEMEA